MSSATLPANPFVATASTGGGSYDLCPSGNHPATLVAIIDLGTVDDVYNGEVKHDVRKLLFAWELSGEIKPNGEPFVLVKDYTIGIKNGNFDANEKSNIRLMIEGWRGKKYLPGEPIDFGALLGKSCLVNVSHTTRKEKDYHNVDKISAMLKGMSAPTPTRQPIGFHISQLHPPDLSWLPYIYGGDPKGMQPVSEVIAQSKERRGQPIGNGKRPDTPYDQAVDTSAGAPLTEIEETEHPF